MMRFRYRNKGSAIHRLSTFPKLAWAVAIIVLSLIFDHPLYIVALLLCSLPLVAAARAWREWASFMKVALWLGHTSTQTTEIYTRVDPIEKLDAIEALVPPTLRRGRFRPPDKLMALLKGSRLREASRARHSRDVHSSRPERHITTRSP